MYCYLSHSRFVGDIEGHLTTPAAQSVQQAFRWGLSIGDQMYGDPVYIVQSLIISKHYKTLLICYSCSKSVIMYMYIAPTPMGCLILNNI